MWHDGQMISASSSDLPADETPDRHAGLEAEPDHRSETEHGNEWDEYAEGWDDDPYVRSYAAAAMTSLRDAVRLAGLSLDGATIVDFGCGTGLLTEQLVDDGAIVTAIDTSTAMLDALEAKIAERGWSQVVTGADLPAGREVWDVVACSSVCSFLDDYPGTVAQLVARLRPGGLFIQWDWERTGTDPHGLSVEEIRKALTGAGLVEITVATAFEVEIGGDTMAPLVGHGTRSVD